MMRKVCVVTGTRAEYGLLYWILSRIRDTEGLELQIIATGMHLAPEFGFTYREIEADGFSIDARVEMLLSSDTAPGVAKSVGIGTIGFADAFVRLAPDVVLVLGDRFEIFAAVQAAFIAGICVAHISGGEVTEGAIDDGFRHCITKMARYHFAATESYRQRIIQLGEAADTVFNVGDPALDNIKRLKLLDREAVSARTGVSQERGYFLVTFHPTTTGDSAPTRELRELLDALDEHSDYDVLLTKANADANGRALNAMIDAYAAARPQRVKAASSLGRLLYLSAMRHCAAVVGNSSSGIIEAPAMHVPTINIGSRQRGRLRAESIIDCPDEKTAISAALSLACTAGFRRRAAASESPYGNCDASERIVSILETIPVSALPPKRFNDLSITGANGRNA